MVTRKEVQPIRIMLAVDGSEHAFAAVQLLSDLPLPQGTEITAIAVMIPREAADKFVMMAAVLDSTSERLTKPDVIVKNELLTGSPAEELCVYADQKKPDLIVMGAKGLRATLGILLGGVAQQVIEYACCPVMVVRAPYSTLRKVMLVTDGSTYSQGAVSYLSRFPLPEVTEVEVAHILPPMPTPDRIIRAWSIGLEGIPPPPLPDVEDDLLKLVETEEFDGHQLLALTQETLNKQGIKAKTTLIRGDAATEIIDYANENHIDLIVAGSRGLSQVRGWLLGSVSRKLVHYAPCSVLIVKEAQTKE